MSGQKLRPGELATLAQQFRLTEAHLRTVIEVETAGSGFTKAGQVEFLFEPHKFYQNVPKEKLDTAIKQGLAYKFWKGPGSYPKTPALRWQQFQAAAALDETAAIESASWGMGQIMGTEHSEAGFDSPQHMLVAFQESEYNQVLGMCNLIRARKLDVQLRLFPDMTACRAFAKRYNGAGYEKNKYHIKLHDAYIRNAGKLTAKGTTDPMADGILSFGEADQEKTGGPIYNMQKAFKEKGYSLLVDGKFGSGTRTTVLAWKANNGLPTNTPDMTISDIEFIPESAMMEVALERATSTVDDLKPTSSIIQDSSTGKKTLGGAAGVLGSLQLADSAGVLDKAQEYADKAEQAKGVWGSVNELFASSGITYFAKFLLSYKFEILIVVVIVAFIIFNRVQKKRLEMHKTAEIG